MMRENAYLTDKQIETLKDKLLSDKERITNKKLQEEKYQLDKNELSDPLDEASVNTQTSQDIRFINRENFYLKKINKSLDAINRGTYGLCEECDGEIGFERLNARLTAELCIACKEEAEHAENNNFFDKKSKSLGRALHETLR
ncbi:MAG: TraR/DksA family transcriptional regulator [Bacteriovorax sp.]